MIRLHSKQIQTCGSPSMMYETHNEQETKKIAAVFAQTLVGGEVVFLSGDLGSGKTTFVRGVAEVFGFRQPVRSPSFTIVNRYPVDHDAIKQILHIDFYRIDDPKELAPLALEEELGRPDTLAFIEWPERFTSFLGTPTQEIAFEVKKFKHTIQI